MAALEVIDRVGFRKAGIKEIAAAVGLSQTGLLHYYESREELLVDVLRKRDEINRARYYDAGVVQSIDELRDQLVHQGQRNSKTRGLVQLFSQLSVDAADPEHPAHAFFLVRNDEVQAHFLAVIRRAQAEDLVSRDVDAVQVARLLQAVSDGLQLRYLADPSFDMATAIDSFFQVLRLPAAGATA